MKYLVTAKVQFEIDSDTRHAAHIAAVDKLAAANLPGWDLWDLDVVPDVPDRPAAGVVDVPAPDVVDVPAEIGHRRRTAMQYTGMARPDFSSLDPTTPGPDKPKLSTYYD